MDDGFRYEIKYTLSPLEYLKFRDICSGFMEIDKNTKSGSRYVVKSHYFDTPYFQDYHEKLNGIYSRQKYRIRTYGSSGYYRLEKKIKEGNRNKKFSGRISADDAASLLKGNMQIKTGADITDSIISEMYMKCCRSSAYIEYERLAYAFNEPELRITFDSNIRTLFGRYLPSEQMPPPIPVFYEGEVIMEVKYKDDLPKWLQKAIYRVVPSEFSVSKYAQSLVYILG